jgi:hypothetical protein
VYLVQPMKTAPVPGVLACLLFFSACTSDVAVPRPSAPVSPEPAEDGPFVRSCQSAVVGDLGRTWRRGAAVSGPIALVGVAAYRKASTRSFAPRGGRYPSLKVLVVVERGAPVTMMVASFKRQPVRLLYDESVWRNDNRYRLSEGERAVTFEPCEDRRISQFNGSFLMRGPRCVGLEVWLEGDPLARALRVPFGRKVSC